VGPIRVRFENRECYVGAVVLGDEVLLGAVPMDDMDLVVIPSARRVVVNPLHPDFAAGPAKQVRESTMNFCYQSADIHGKLIHHD
jgi:hypothetical protein